MSSHDLIARWVIVSVVGGFAAECFMFIWLRRHGARPSIFRMNTPTHLHRVHRRWCAEHGRRPGWMGWLMPVAAINLCASLVALFLSF